MIFKKGTQVKVISGSDKGKTGEILEINRKLGKLKMNQWNNELANDCIYAWIIAFMIGFITE